MPHGQQGRVEEARGARRRGLADVVVKGMSLGHGLRVAAHDEEVDDLGGEVPAGGRQHRDDEASGHEHGDQDDERAARGPESSTSQGGS